MFIILGAVVASAQIIGSATIVQTATVIKLIQNLLIGPIAGTFIDLEEDFFTSVNFSHHSCHYLLVGKALKGR